MTRRIDFKRTELQRVLDRRNMSRNAFANRLGISKSHVSQILNGKRNPSPALRAKILTVLSVTWERLFDSVPTVPNDSIESGNLS